MIWDHTSIDLRRYALTEAGYKQKFYDSKPEKGESPQQFIVRLEDYFLRWIELAKVDQTFDDVKELLVREILSYVSQDFGVVSEGKSCNEFGRTWKDSRTI